MEKTSIDVYRVGYLNTRQVGVWHEVSRRKAFNTRDKKEKKKKKRRIVFTQRVATFPRSSELLDGFAILVWRYVDSIWNGPFPWSLVRTRHERQHIDKRYSFVCSSENAPFRVHFWSNTTFGVFQLFPSALNPVSSRRFPPHGLLGVTCPMPISGLRLSKWIGRPYRSQQTDVQVQQRS